MTITTLEAIPASSGKNFRDVSMSSYSFDPVYYTTYLSWTVLGRLQFRRRLFDPPPPSAVWEVKWHVGAWGWAYSIAYSLLPFYLQLIRMVYHLPFLGYFVGFNSVSVRPSALPSDPDTR